MEETPRRIAGQHALRAFLRNKGAVAGAGMLLLLLALLLVGPLMIPYDPVAMDPAHRLAPPSRQHPMGTDQFGRDVASRFFYGGRTTLRAPLLPVIVAACIGTIVGISSGYLGGAIDAILMRLVDMMIAVPALLLAMVIVATLGTGLSKVMIAIAIAQVSTYARLGRGCTLSAKENDYVLAAQAIGCGSCRIVFRHILPNVISPVLILCTTAIAWAIIIGASMSFLGFGLQPPAPEWGSELNWSREYLRVAWWMGTFPGLGIATAVLAVNLIGDGVQEALDPRVGRY